MLGIIVLHYNTYEKTIDCVDSILKTVKKTDYKIYVVDNCSPNGSFERLKDMYGAHKKIKLLKTDANLGYAKGNNYGIEYAERDGCDALLFSNNDIIYYEGTIDTLYSELKNSDAAMIAPKVVNVDESIMVSFKPAWYSFFEYMKKETYLSNIFKPKETDIPRSPERMFWLSGCCFMAKTSDFQTLGRFDRHTFLYYEEYILAQKANAKGMKLLFYPEVSVLHYHMASVGKLNLFVTIEHNKSELYYLMKYTDWSAAKINTLMLMRLAEVVFSWGKEKKWGEIREYIAAMRTMKATVKQYVKEQ